MRDDRERLQDILEAIAQVEKYSVRGRQVFDQDELVQVWIVHHLQIINRSCQFFVIGIDNAILYYSLGTNCGLQKFISSRIFSG